MVCNGDITEAKGWEELCKQIILDIKKKGKNLPLSHLNQLLMLLSFATLRLKQVSRIAASEENARQWHNNGGLYLARRICVLARHYQIFEQLPPEKCGGHANAHSWLYNEAVKRRTREYLVAQHTGKVTPHGLQHALPRAWNPSKVLSSHARNSISKND